MVIQSATYQRKLEVDREVLEDKALKKFGLRREDMKSESVTSVATCDADVVL